MLCYHCNEEIKGRVRYLTVGDKRVPFHQGTLFKDCVNEYLRSQQSVYQRPVLKPCPANE